MSEKSFSELHLYGTDSPQADARLDWSSASQLRQQLLAEICVLDKQRDALERLSDKTDFSMRQTYREMIHSRQSLYRQLNR